MDDCVYDELMRWSKDFGKMHRVFDSMEEALWVALFPFSGISQGRWSAMPKMITRNVVDIKEFETECGRRQND